MRRVPTYSRKVLLLAGSGALLLFIAVQAGVYLQIKLHESANTRHLEQQQKKLNSLSPEERAVHKAQTNLTSSVGRIDSGERLFIDYLQRRFDLDKTLSSKQNPISIPQDDQPVSMQIKYLARIAYPNNVLSEAPKSSLEGAALTNIYAANCDVLPLPSTFWQTMENSYKAGGYSLTHVPLALAFIKDNGCAVPAAQQDLLQRSTASMVKLMDDPMTNQDLRYEILAFLQLSGRHDEIKSQWIEQVISEQLPNGGWSDKKGSQQQNYHSTVLATWALLEYSRPGLPYEPIIHRPSNEG